MDDQHIYHHNDTQPRVAVSAERNSRGTTYSASVSNCQSVAEAMVLLEDALYRLDEKFGSKVTVTETVK